MHLSYHIVTYLVVYYALFVFEEALTKQDNISINQFVATALAEKMSALVTENFLSERASRGTKKKFKTALSKIKSYSQIWCLANESSGGLVT